MLKKIIIILLVGSTIYYVGHSYTTSRLYEIMPQCFDNAKVEKANKLNSTKLKMEYIQEFWSCVQSKKTPLDNILFKIFNNQIPNA